MISSNKEKYRQAFSALHSNQEVDLSGRSNSRIKPAMTTGILLAIAVGCTTAVLSQIEVVSSFFTFGNNATIASVVEDGQEGTSVTLHTENLTPPAEFKDGRLYFTAYDQKIDITDKVSTQECFIFSHENDGITAYVVVGLNDDNDPSNFGFAEYYQTNSGMVGYSAMTNTEKDGSGLPWLEKAKAQLGVK